MQTFCKRCGSIIESETRIPEYWQELTVMRAGGRGKFVQLIARFLLCAKCALGFQDYLRSGEAGRGITDND